MHVPPPSDYFPLDSDAPTVFAHNQIGNYIMLAVATLVLYDHMITIDIEVERIWTLKWGLPKILFFLSRYVIPPMLMVTVIQNISYPLPFAFCASVSHFSKPIQALSLSVVELVVIVRISALYGHNKIMLSFLGCLFTCQLAAVIVATHAEKEHIITKLYYEYLPGCWYILPSNRSTTLWSTVWGIPFTCGEGILLILILVKAFTYRDNFNPTIRLLARDSVLYFIPMFATLIWDLVYNQGILSIPSEWIACIAVSRMMLSLRSLAFNDPLSTQRLKFSTMVFQNRERRDDAEEPGLAEQRTGGV